jgi:hypothetical protein
MKDLVSTIAITPQYGSILLAEYYRFGYQGAQSITEFCNAMSTNVTSI